MSEATDRLGDAIIAEANTDLLSDEPVDDEPAEQPVNEWKELAIQNRQINDDLLEQHYELAGTVDQLEQQQQAQEAVGYARELWDEGEADAYEVLEAARDAAGSPEFLSLYSEVGEVDPDAAEAWYEHQVRSEQTELAAEQLARRIEARRAADEAAAQAAQAAARDWGEFVRSEPHFERHASTFSGLLESGISHAVPQGMTPAEFERWRSDTFRNAWKLDRAEARDALANRIVADNDLLDPQEREQRLRELERTSSTRLDPGVFAPVPTKAEVVDNLVRAAGDLRDPIGAALRENAERAARPSRTANDRLADRIVQGVKDLDLLR